MEIRKGPNKSLSERSGRAKSTVMELLPDAKALSSTEVPKHNFGGGRRKKTSRHTDAIMKRELLKNPQLTGLGLKNMHADLLKQVAIRTVQHCLQKG